MNISKRWIVYDRNGYAIYLTDERWSHILEFHCEMAHFEDELITTLKRGSRKQDPLDTSVYSYFHSCDHLPDRHTHVIVIVKFKTRSNCFVLTAYQKTLYSQR